MNHQKQMEVQKSSDEQPKPRQNPNEKYQNPKPNRRKILSAQTQNHGKLSIDFIRENCDTASTGLFKTQVIKQR